MTKVKGFHYDTEKDLDVMQHLSDQQNISKYIVDLIRKDMKQESIEAIVQRYVEKYMQGYTPSLVEPVINMGDIREIMGVTL